MPYRLLAALVRRYVRWRGGADRPRELLSSALPGQSALPAAGHAVGADERDLTVMYCGIRRYPFISARYRDDLRSLALLTNRFIAVMTGEIHRHGGTVDKFMDGRLMAFWNAPLRVDDHPARACHAARAMQAAMISVNDALRGLLPADDGTLPIEAAIAIDTGLCAVGMIGSARWSDFTAVGFPVRRAGLLEQRTRLAGSDILVTESVVDAVTGFDFHEVTLDFPRLRGGGPKLAYELRIPAAGPIP